MRLESGPTVVRAFTARDLSERARIVAANRAHTAPWDPERPERWYERSGQVAELRLDVEAWSRRTAFAFAVLERETMIGRIALANIVRGPWQNATIGWWIAAAQCGRGHATRAVRLVLEFAFEHAGLHRVQPAIIPRNVASVRVAEHCGFRCEGRALRYLNIAGVWEDHDIYALTAEEWHTTRSLAGTPR